VSVHSGSPVWSKLLSPVYEEKTKWGSRGFKGEGNKEVGESPIRMLTTVIAGAARGLENG
jgi:hypothetical protein